MSALLPFALLRPLLWEWTGPSLSAHAGAKAWFSTTAIATGTLWLYAVAYGMKNRGINVITHVEGFVGGWW